MLNNIKYYLRIWYKLTTSSFQTVAVSRLGAAIFILAKILRFVLLLLVVLLIVGKTKSLAGYSLLQTLIFLITFNILDTLAQLLFRDVYRFRPKIVSGDFDLNLVKPINPLFQVLLGGADILDLVMLIPYVIFLTWLLIQTPMTLFNLILYLLLMINGLLIATAFHISVLALGVITTEIDHAIFIYRDLTNMARFPIDIFREPLRSFVTYIIPIGIMMSFPPKALFGYLQGPFIIIAFVLGFIFLLLSLKFWSFSLSQYSSASS